jgi:hypothetical protein
MDQPPTPVPSKPNSASGSPLRGGATTRGLPRSRPATAPLDAALAAGVGTLAFLVYFFSLAPGLTWSHQGADGGELVAAAVVNGVPHPPGYPLYMLLLQGWLGVTNVLWPGAELNWRGALFSALCAALSAGVTFLTARHLLRHDRHGRLWAAPAAVAWAVSPLLWMQAVIAEVYALHALLLALLGWAVLVHPQRLWYVVIPVALGVANHLTFVLLLPAAFYILWAERNRHAGERQGKRWGGLLPIGAAFAVALVLGALLYVRIPLAAAGTPPVNWGYADNWNGFWWLVSGTAYRGYLFASPAGSLLTRLATWAATVTAQYTPVGLALALIGLAYWDRTAGHLRNFSLLWVAPISAYAVAYYTRDSDIYLLPVGWIMALWLAVGLAQVEEWITQRAGQSERGKRTAGVVLAGLVGLGLLGVTVWRWDAISLADDRQARDYLQQVGAVLEPESILVTLEDRETFAVWFGVWGSGELAAAAPGVTPLNESLYQFEWYRRLQGELYPEIPGIGQSVDAVVAANRGQRPIYFAQLPANIAQTDVTQVGPLWRLNE